MVNLCFCRRSSMTIISHASPTCRVGTYITRCAIRCNGVYRIGMANNAEASRMKESCVRFSSSSCYSAKISQVLHLDNAGIGIRRGHRAIVAASPPTEDAVVVTEPLTKEDLVGYLASGCKPKEKWRYLDYLIIIFQCIIFCSISFLLCFLCFKLLPCFQASLYIHLLCKNQLF